MVPANYNAFCSSLPCGLGVPAPDVFVWKSLPPWRGVVRARVVYTAAENRPRGPLRAKGDTEPFSMESLKKAMDSFKKESSVQDLLKEQMRERDFDGDGGDGNSGGGGGDEGSGGQEDDMFDEILQVVFATLGIISLYIYILYGEELFLLARDYIRYRVDGRTTMRLQSAMNKWNKLYNSIVWRGVVHEDWLERAIIATPTWWHDPREQASLYTTPRSRQHL